MSATSEYYLSQADACAQEAAAATLDNVRERCLRSEESWRAMAARLHRAEALRVQLSADKAARDGLDFEAGIAGELAGDDDGSEQAERR